MTKMSSVLPDAIRHILIKSPQQDRADHHRRVETQSRQKSRTLERDVGGSDDEGLARGLFLPENVVAGDAALLGAGVATWEINCIVLLWMNNEFATTTGENNASYKTS